MRNQIWHLLTLWRFFFCKCISYIYFPGQLWSNELSVKSGYQYIKNECWFNFYYVNERHFKNWYIQKEDIIPSLLACFIANDLCAKAGVYLYIFLWRTIVGKDRNIITKYSEFFIVVLNITYKYYFKYVEIRRNNLLVKKCILTKYYIRYILFFDVTYKI